MPLLSPLKSSAIRCAAKRAEISAVGMPVPGTGPTATDFATELDLENVFGIAASFSIPGRDPYTDGRDKYRRDWSLAWTRYNPSVFRAYDANNTIYEAAARLNMWPMFSGAANCDGTCSSTGGCDGLGGVRDVCGVCNGDGSSCAGCDGNPAVRPSPMIHSKQTQCGTGR